MSFAVVKTGGKQYKVAQGDVLMVEKLEVAEGDKVVLTEVLLTDTDGEVKVGTPTVAGAKVEAICLENGKRAKVLVLRYKNKINYRKVKGHRQPFTKLQIEKIS